MKNYLTAIVTALAVCLVFSNAIVEAQTVAYESFTGLSLGSGVNGSGTTASGWADAGWSDGSDSRFQTVDPTPDLSFQISGGALLAGGDRALQLSTFPEPVPGVLRAARNIPAQNTTLYFSFLVRPVSIGTGSDSIELRIGSGNVTYVRIGIRPDQSASYMAVGAYSADGGGIGAIPLLPGQTYLVVACLARPFATTYSLSYWVNPPSAYPGVNGAISNSINGVVSTVGFSTASTDTGGPASTVIVDELRVGYTWADVVPPAPPPPVVPDVQIKQATKLQWPTLTVKSYQVQISYDLSTWNNTGTPITGDGSLKTFFDSVDQDAKKFYRIQIK